MRTSIDGLRRRASGGIEAERVSWATLGAAHRQIALEAMRSPGQGCWQQEELPVESLIPTKK